MLENDGSSFIWRIPKTKFKIDSIEKTKIHVIGMISKNPNENTSGRIVLKGCFKINPAPFMDKYNPMQAKIRGIKNLTSNELEFLYMFLSLYRKFGFCLDRLLHIKYQP